ncbi:uncharacterized protein PHALS_02841 [Plasmopara halstedii]|uniref:Uncharacterized protein n=1 Tax=Plasmopara halstedii TaxID=4781 RepID=A0A0P1AZP5_PLAHL|nr:uncharacterized protein PHALS_02841 [Plasmopara halstedii]CEG46440.1 hypothetical protein PHALS_02841 [Plasmopara halstedii]|eukprot:XP_024582809.1 hypothetical protein PHALS_02841 [Plasmopara halstedii]
MSRDYILFYVRVDHSCNATILVPLLFHNACSSLTISVVIVEWCDAYRCSITRTDPALLRNKGVPSGTSVVAFITLATLRELRYCCLNGIALSQQLKGCGQQIRAPYTRLATTCSTYRQNIQAYIAGASLS